MISASDTEPLKRIKEFKSSNDPLLKASNNNNSDILNEILKINFVIFDSEKEKEVSKALKM